MTNAEHAEVDAHASIRKYGDLREEVGFERGVAIAQQLAALIVSKTISNSSMTQEELRQTIEAALLNFADILMEAHPSSEEAR